MGYDGRGKTYPIDLVQGDDFAITVTAVDSAGDPVSLAGATTTGTVLNATTRALVDTMTDAVGGAGSNVITLSFTDTETAALAVGRYRWTLEVTRGADTRQWLSGGFTVHPAGSEVADAGSAAPTVTVDATETVTVYIAATGAVGAGSGDLVSTNNLSDVANAVTATQNLSVEVGVDVQAYSAVLDALAAQTDLAVAHGGTGASTAADARTNLGVDAAGTDNSTDVTLAGTGTYVSLSGQELTIDPITESDISDLAHTPEGTAILSTGETGGTKFLREDGDGTSSWQTPAGSGNVSTTGVPVAADFAKFTDATTIQGRSLAETLADMSLEIGTDVQAWSAVLDALAAGTDLAVAAGGTGASTAGDARTNLGVAIGSDVQAYAAALDAVSGTNTGDEVAATATTSGIVELATIAEVDTGTDTDRAVTPAGLAGSALQATADSALQNVVEDTTPQLGGNLDANSNTITGLDASATAKGIVELATDAETETGTDTARATTPSNVASAYPKKSILTTKGDILAATGASTPARLAVGSNDQVLTADSAESTGMKWAAAAGGGPPALSVPFSLDGGTTRHYSIPGATVTAALRASTTMGGSSSTQIWYFPVYVLSDISIDALIMNVWSAGAGANVRLGLYNANAYWFPTSLVVDAGAASAASTGIKTLSFTSTAIPAGRYHLAAQPDGVAAFTPLTFPGQLLGGWGQGLNAASQVQNLKTGSTTYAAFASTAYTTGIATTTGTQFEWMALMRSV